MALSSSQQPSAHWVVKYRCREGRSLAEVSTLIAACVVGMSGLSGQLCVELWCNGDGEFIQISEWASVECLHRGLEVMRGAWNQGLVAFFSILHVQSIVAWFGVATEIPSDFGLNNASTKRLLRIPMKATHIEMYPDRDSRRLSSRAGFYFNNPYSLAPWTCQVLDPRSAVVTSVVSVPKFEVNAQSPVTIRTVAARVLIEGGVERICCASRSCAPRPEVGSLLIVKTREGTTCLGRCVNISRWTPHRTEHGVNHVLRHVNYSDLVHFQANVVPLNEKAFMVAARYLHGQRPRTVELESAEALFDLSGMVLRCRWVGAPVASWTEDALVATVRSELGYDKSVNIIVVGLPARV
jgi:hypothetical protein